MKAATTGQKLLSSQATDKDLDLMVIAVDLQQILLYPKLSFNRANYTQKVWLYNLCVVDVKAQKFHNFVWDESVGWRAADDVASCFLIGLKKTVLVKKKKEYLVIIVLPGLC